MHFPTSYVVVAEDVSTDGTRWEGRGLMVGIVKSKLVSGAQQYLCYPNAKKW